MIQYDFKNSYNFTSDAFVIGRAILSGLSNVEIQVDANGNVDWHTDMDVDFYDRFEYPWDVFNVFSEPFDTGDPFDIKDSWQEHMRGQSYSSDGSGSFYYDYEYGY
ncbi:MAG: hypothetical protein ACWIPJ_10720 [Polaribacter sp.]